MTEKVLNREDWLELRKSGIGASEAASAVNLNKYKSCERLWEEKTGRIDPEDISDNPRVKYGTEAEEHLRKLFALDFPQYEVFYEEFKIIRHPEYPYIFATLDGELIERETGRKGILEIKTSQPETSIGWNDWKERIPQNYYIQVLHQFIATGYDFAILKAQLKSVRDDDVNLYTRHYYREREDVKEDIEWLLKEEIKFWDMVVNDKRPNLILDI